MIGWLKRNWIDLVAVVCLLTVGFFWGTRFDALPLRVVAGCVLMEIPPTSLPPVWYPPYHDHLPELP
jgi:hypothetical protein